MSPEDGTRFAMKKRTGYLIVAVLLLVQIALLIALLLVLREPVSQPTANVAGIQVLRVFYGPGTGDKPFFDRPMGAAFTRDGRVYVADTGNHRIVVFNGDGRFLFSFGTFGVAKPAKGGTFSWAPGRFNYPTDVAIDDDGSVYVADFRNDQIQVFDRAGRFLRVFPDRTKRVGKGASGQDGTGIGVTSIAVHNGRVYATDRYQIMVFSTAGKLLTQFGKPGSGPGDLDHPNGIAVGLDSNLVVSDSDHNRVISFTQKGKRLWGIGGVFGAQSNAKSQGVEVPRGIAVKGDGTFLVSDAMAGRILQVTPKGQITGTFGEYGQSAGALNFPTDVDVLDNRVLVTEKGGNRVQVLTLSK